MQKIKPTFMMKTFWFLLFCILMSCFFACRRQPPKQEAIYRPGTALLKHAYERFREKSLTKRQFKHRDIAPLIRQHAAGGSLRVEELGKSVKQRPVYQLTFGKGAIKVMLWSQMHGDESTATMALFDLFNFLEGENDEFDSLRTLLAKKPRCISFRCSIRMAPRLLHAETLMGLTLTGMHFALNPRRPVF